MRLQELFDVSYQVIDIERFEDHVNALRDKIAFLLANLLRAAVHTMTGIDVIARCILSICSIATRFFDHQRRSPK